MRGILFAVIFFTVACSSPRETKRSTLNVDEAIKSGSFTFFADMVYPLSMRSHPIAPPATLILKADSLAASLPYFGKAHSFDPNAAGGITFTTRDFQRSAVKDSNGDWTVTITPKDEVSANEIVLTVFENGKAMATITSLRRDRIQFRGYIQPMLN